MTPLGCHSMPSPTLAALAPSVATHPKEIPPCLDFE
jgi:hypothetical protein